MPLNLARSPARRPPPPPPPPPPLPPPPLVSVAPILPRRAWAWSGPLLLVVAQVDHLEAGGQAREGQESRGRREGGARHRPRRISPQVRARVVLTPSRVETWQRCVCATSNTPMVSGPSRASAGGHEPVAPEAEKGELRNAAEGSREWPRVEVAGGSSRFTTCAPSFTSSTPWKFTASHPTMHRVTRPTCHPLLTSHLGPYITP